MVPLLMVMVYILAEHMPEGALAKEDHPGQRFVFDRADPALGIGIQIRRRRRQWDPRDPSIINDLLKRGAELGVSVMHERLARGQEPHSCMVTWRATGTIHAS